VANSNERAKQLLLSHPNLITSVESMICDVAESEINKNHLHLARELLARFNDKVRLALADKTYEDQMRFNEAAKQKIKSQKRTIAVLTNKVNTLEERIVELENINPQASWLNRPPR
jgi:hypothetical protein